VETLVKKWGNSAAVRIPAVTLKTARLSLNDAVSLRVEGGRIVIEASTPPTMSIEDLVAGIDASNLHDAADYGPPVGKEVW
jgi:antitoxin MazE